MAFQRRIGVLILASVVLGGSASAGPDGQAWMKDSTASLEKELTSRHGEAQAERIRGGLKQASQFWRAEDGDRETFETFVKTSFAGDAATLDALFSRMELLLESLNGHMVEITRDFKKQADLELGPIYPFDETFAGYDPSAHVNDDFFDNKIAFVVLLNFPITSLEERLENGHSWSRRQWAETRLAETFSKRVPASVNLAISTAEAEASRYIAQYNIWMHHLVDARGARLFPAKLRLLSHWNLRDEIKADYSDSKNGPAKQRMVQAVMERIVTQTIPGAVVNNPHVDWNPVTNEVRPVPPGEEDGPAGGTGKPASGDPEPDTRYAVLLKTFQASRLADPYSPTAPSLIARRFNENRQIPEERVRKMLEDVLTSPLVPRVASVIKTRLGRPLEPFDVWYNGFRARGGVAESELDEIVRKRYPTAEAYKKDIPELLVKLGFTREKADYLGAHIVVDPARGSGHALGAGRRGDDPHLRTRVEAGGMNYKGFNIAVHEMGHNVEQIFSLNGIDHTLLAGVPNTAFTEALAFVFQAHDLELLGQAGNDAEKRALTTLNDFWGTYEIAGVALVDMGAWHFMYEHPKATPAELKEAVLRLSKDTWNRFYAPVLGHRDTVLLGIYSHMIHSFLYLPDYPIGHMIAFQIERQMEKAGNLGAEFERMAKSGNIAPDLWMTNATGAPVGPEALLAATAEALGRVEKTPPRK
jgi:hypothetical protein